MKFTFSAFILSQWATLPPVLHADLTSKTVVVIGANTGLGFEAAKHFARMKPARLVLGCRSEERGRKAAEAIAADLGYAAELQLVDLAKFASVQEFATRIGDAPVDVLVMNAGIVVTKYATTADNWETSLQVNHLGTALLSLLLTPNMARAARDHQSTSRLVIVSSEVHSWAKFEKVIAAPHILQALNDKEYCLSAETMDHRYPDTKLLNVFFTRAYAEELKGSASTIASAVNPGYCYTEIRRNMPFGTRVQMSVMDLFLGRTAEKGSRQLVYAALGPDGKSGPHERHLQGAYVSSATVVEPSDLVISKEGYEAQEKLWRETIDILKQVNPNVDAVIQTYF